MDIAAGEYGYDLFYFRRMLEAGAVDVLQADATRCGGITGFLQVGALCEARCAAAVGPLRPVAARPPVLRRLPSFRHLEYFHDHDRIEHMLFDGALTPVEGALRPDLSRPGLGLEFKRTGRRPVRRLSSRPTRSSGKDDNHDYRDRQSEQRAERSAPPQRRSTDPSVRRRLGARGRAARGRSRAKSASTPAAAPSMPPTARTTARCRSAS